MQASYGEWCQAAGHSTFLRSNGFGCPISRSTRWDHTQVACHLTVLDECQASYYNLYMAVAHSTQFSTITEMATTVPIAYIGIARKWSHSTPLDERRSNRLMTDATERRAIRFYALIQMVTLILEAQVGIGGNASAEYMTDLDERAGYLQ